MRSVLLYFVGTFSLEKLIPPRFFVFSCELPVFMRIKLTWRPWKGSCLAPRGRRHKLWSSAAVWLNVQTSENKQRNKCCNAVVIENRRAHNVRCYLEVKAGHDGQLLHGQLLGGLLVTMATTALDLGTATEVLRPGEPGKSSKLRVWFVTLTEEYLNWNPVSITSVTCADSRWALWLQWCDFLH